MTCHVAVAESPVYTVNVLSWSRDRRSVTVECQVPAGSAVGAGRANGVGRVLLYSWFKGGHAERGAMMKGRKTRIAPPRKLHLIQLLAKNRRWPRITPI